MRARGFNKRIDIYQATKVSDDFGGYTNDVALIATTWANIKTTNAGSNITSNGVIDVSNSMIVTIRKRSDLVLDIETMYIVYRGINYSISTDPVNSNFEDAVIQFIATKQSLKND